MAEQVMGLLENIKTSEYEGQKKANFTIDGQLFNVPKNEPELLESFHDGTYRGGEKVVVTYRLWKNAGKDHFLVEGIDVTEPPAEDHGPAPSTGGGVHLDDYTIGTTCGSILKGEIAAKGDLTKIDWKAVEETIILALLLRVRVNKRVADGELAEDVPF